MSTPREPYSKNIQHLLYTLWSLSEEEREEANRIFLQGIIEYGDDYDIGEVFGYVHFMEQKRKTWPDGGTINEIFEAMKEER